MKKNMKYMMKRPAAVLLALLLTLPALPGAQGAWSGKGTAEDPYLITTPAQLQDMEDNLSAHYRLAADVDMRGIIFRPVGNETTGVFTGSFDGGGYTISNLTIDGAGGKYVGLFGYCEGAVTRVAMENVSVTGGRYVGAVAGYCAGGGTLTDCLVTGTVSAESGIISVHVGGLAGELGENTTLTNCSFSGSVSAESTGKAVSYICAGGLVGELSADATLTDCTSSGDINADGGDSDVYAGGLVGRMGERGVLTDCASSGGVSAEGTGSVCAGGLVGELSADAMLTDCTSSGDINADGGYSDVYAGGLVGRMGEHGVLTDCASSGDVSAYNRDYDYDSDVYAGGLVGKLGADATLTDCDASGDVSAFDDDLYSYGGASAYGGGLVGRLDADATLTDCTFSGNVETYASGEKRQNMYISFDYAGGLVGRSSHSAYEGCVNYGAVDGEGFVGGIVGASGGGESFTRCTNYGAVSGYLLSGGIAVVISADSGNSVSVTECANYGTVDDAGIVLIGNVGEYSAYINVVRCFNGGHAYYGITNGNGDAVVSECMDTGGADFTGAPSDCVSLMDSVYGGERNLSLNLPLWADGMRTLEELHQAEEWLNWDFENVWQVDERYNSGLPMLRNLPEHPVLSEIVLILSPGESAPITAYWQGENVRATWSTSDASVASVNGSGTVTAVGNGSCTVSAELANGMRTKCVVHVITCTDTLTLPESAVIGYVYGRITLTPTVSEGSNEVFLWSSSNNYVAGVNENGEVTGRGGAGTAVITVTAYPSLKSAQCTVTVGTTVVVTGVDIAEAEAELQVGEQIKLSAAVTPSDATDKSLTWTSSDKSVVTVDQNGWVTAVGSGRAVITAMSSNGLYDTCDIMVPIPSSAVFEVGDVRAVTGGEVEVPVYIRRNPGVAAFTLSVVYNGELLTPISVEAGEILAAGELTSNADTAAADGNLQVTWYSAADMTEDGMAFLLRFRVGDTVGTSEISLAFEKNDICNSEKVNVGFKVEAGQVNVLNVTVGDIYRDEAVNMKDIVYFARWFNGQETMTEEQTLAADLHYDSVLDVKDLTALAQILSESIQPTGAANTTARLERPISAMDTASAKQAEPFTVTVSDRVFQSSGTAAVTVRGEHCPGIASFRFRLEVPEGYTVESVLPAALTETGNFAYNEATGIVSWYYTEDLCLDGDLFTICLRAGDGASGTGQVELSYNENDFFAAESYENVAVEVHSGSVRVLPEVEVTDVVLEDSGVAVTLEAAETVTCRVMAVFYFNGRMVLTTMGEARTNGGQVELDIDLPQEWDTCKVFVLDTQLWIPLCRSEVLPFG